MTTTTTTTTDSTNPSFRLLSFNTADNAAADGFSHKEFTIQMFGVNERGQTVSLFVKGYQPFFYVQVGEHWTESEKVRFDAQIAGDVGEQIASAIHSTKLIKRKKLYGFDGGKLYNFVQLNFLNETAMKKVKGLWYSSSGAGGGEYRLNPAGYLFEETEQTVLYEAQIPSLLRFFHIKEISPSGWIELPSNKIKKLVKKTTSCTYEYNIHFDDIIPLPHKEKIVPYKICSFDIEASSSHGDFPLPVKNYKKLATNMVDVCKQQNTYTADLLRQIILTAFGFETVDNVDKVYPIIPVTDRLLLEETFTTWIKIKPVNYKTDHLETDLGLSEVFGANRNNNNNNNNNNKRSGGGSGSGGGGGGSGGNNENSDREDEEEEEGDEDVVDEGTAAASDMEKLFNWRNVKPKTKTYTKRGTILDLLLDADETRETKLLELTRTLTASFPQLEGDNVTFIGSTFLRYGDEKPYLNHCIVRDTCNALPNAVIETYKTEKEVLLAWTELIQREDPDIVIGYNIFGFDYQFMYLRAKELKCERSFLRLSRNKNEICLKRDWRTGKEGLEENTLVIASGQHDLKFAKMTGRLQIDMYNYLRRDYQLTQYKLDYVSGYFIGDGVKKLEYSTGAGAAGAGAGAAGAGAGAAATYYTKVFSKNLTGLEVGSYINFEEEAHSVDAYKNGQKFEVLDVDYANGTFMIAGKETPDLVTKKVRWGLAKDDVTPQDIFRMTNEGPAERAVIAKYCIQDCNLVHHLMRKIDVMTDYSEMASLCSVPMDFLVMRGQSIKLTSYIAKKCRAKGTLMPVIEKSMDDEGYEGATVLDPKCNLYLDDPVACLDYAGLYPSSMISDNISHDSKVWTREYDLAGKVLKETGEKDIVTGKYTYDQLPGYEYVDITYNTYKWQRKNGNPKAGMEKIKVGSKVCRFAQFPIEKTTGKPGRAVMPAILEELLAARKATRKLIPEQKDEFMKNILEKRQLSIKVTANSLYGQTGAKTSSFYEKDCAASTTAIGRKLLTYAKRVVEEAYADAVVPTKEHGMVRTNAEYVYGDTDSVFFKFNLTEMDGTPIKGQKALALTIELAQQAGVLASKFLKNPHDLEYEKTFLPFCLLSKKRYVGMLYEDDPTKCKRKSMGIVLKRRDNAPIVKDIYGGVIDILMKEKNVEMAANFLKACLKNMVDEKYGMDKLIITKSLRSGYKNPNQIAHKVLADRIGRRDPGNKPSVGDRIAFVYIDNPNKKALQGERIETPEYIVEQKLKINYSFYITNQIMKPLQQLFALVLEQLKDFKKVKGHTLRTWKNALEVLRKEYPEDDKYRDKEDALRNKEVKALLFDPYLLETNNMKNGNRSITQFFTPVSSK